MSTLRDYLTVDAPVNQTASFRFGAPEFAAIDDKIRACEEHLVRSLVRGVVAPNYLVLAGSANGSLLAKGAAVCCAGTSNALEIDAATNANLAAQAGRIVGVLASDSPLGAFASVVVAGVVPASLTGLGTGSAGPVYVDGETARLTRSATAYQVGTCDAVGNVLLGVASGGGGGTSVTFAGDLAGSSSSQSVRGLYGKSLTAAPTTTGQVYVYNGTSFALQTATATATANALIKANASGKIDTGWLTYGTTSGTCTEGNDSRLSDARTPLAHATSHKHGGTDEISTATATANAIPKADAGGKLAIGWIPTGKTSSTCMIGDDSRVVPDGYVSEYSTGCSTVVTGSRVTAVGPAGRWWNCGAIPTSTANSTSSVTVTGTFRVGEPIRILEKTPIIHSSATAMYVYSTTISAVKGSILDRRLCAYYKFVLVSGTTYRVEIYSDERCNSLIGHTASFDANFSGNTSALTIVADNSSGLAGSIVVKCTLTEYEDGLVTRVQLGKTGIITAYNPSTNLLSFAGQAISTASTNILEVWQGAPELVVQYDVSIPGSYAGSTTSTGLKTATGIVRYWDGPNATLCQLLASHSTVDTGASQPKLAAILAGTQLVADGSALTMSGSTDTRVSTTVEMTAKDMVCAPGAAVELRVIAGTTGNARNLAATLKFVED